MCPCSPEKYKIGRSSPSNVDIFLKTMVVEGKLSFDNRYYRPQKQRGKSPPRTDGFFNEHFGARISTKMRKRNTFHSSGQISNNLDWEKNGPKVSKRYAAAFLTHFSLTIQVIGEEGGRGGEGTLFPTWSVFHQNVGKLW